ncbi:MAG: zeta toxin family protein [Candidatus Melainabacteria bacterium]|nr:zeta toxin family protein [Candidatus Melainabacteria bacterium]
MTQKTIIIIAGPNGAGKTTFAREFLPNEAACPVFINADLIAAGLSPFNPELVAIAAGRMMLEQIADHARRGQSFAFETTLSGRGYVRLIRKWRNDGFLVVMFFLCLASPEEAIARVAERVAQGGHHVPESVIRRRFAAGLQNFETLYRQEVDFWRRYNNSGDVLEILDEGTNP